MIILFFSGQILNDVSLSTKYFDCSNNAQFFADVNVSGSINKSACLFKIDHPLDPENKFLMHSCIESPDMKNLYDGIVVLDEKGSADVELPSYFEALNKDFRYQLTCIGGFAEIYIKDEVKNNRFTIAGGTSGMKVSWQVTGIRKDAYAEKHPMDVEKIKSPEERGKYISPSSFGLPDERGIYYNKEQEEKKHQREMEKEKRKSAEPHGKQ